MRKIFSVMLLLGLCNHVIAYTTDEILNYYYSSKVNNSYPSITDGDTTYCMDGFSQQVVNSSPKQQYILASGFPCDPQSGEVISYHASAGVIGMFVLSHNHADDWNLTAANPLIPSGSWGEPNRDWTLTLFNPNDDIYGFVGEDGYGSMGEVIENKIILLPFQGGITQSFIGIHHSYEGATAILETAKVELMSQPDATGYFPLAISFTSAEGEGDAENGGFTEDGESILNPTVENKGSEIVGFDSFNGCYETKISPLGSECVKK